MIGAVVQGHADVDHRKAERSALQIFDHALFHRRDKLLGHDAADDLVDEDEARSARLRFDLDHTVAELAVATGLPFVAAALRHRLADGFLVGHAGRMGVELDPVFAHHLFDRDLEVDFALAGQRHFVQFGVLLEHQRRLFLDQLGDGGGQLDLVLAVSGFDRQPVDRRQHLRRLFRRRSLAA